MKITNPTENEISIQFKGLVYAIPAKDSISNVGSDVATYWKTMIHEFIQVEEDGAVEVPVESPKEVPKEEVKEDAAPIRKVKSKK